MTLQTMLYFSSILLTCLLTGCLAWVAWKHQQVPAARAYLRLTLSECFFALAEIFSVLSPSSATALFWFQVRYIAGAFMAVFWFAFALEYSGRREWLSQRLLAGLFVIPFVTQVLLWSNPLHGLWMKQEAGFTQNGVFWIADIATRLPGLGYLTHMFYTLLLTLAGIALMFLTAWNMRREFTGQALLLAGAGLTAFTFALNSLFNFLPKIGFNPFTPGIGLSVLLIALSVFRFEFLKRAPAQEDILHVTRFNAQDKRSLAIFILIFILLTSGLAAVSILTYQNYEKQFRAQVESQLSAIAALNAKQLQNWRAERLADAHLFYQNKNFSGRVRSFLENPQASEAQAGLLAYLEKVALFPEYDRVFLLDAQGVERISIPATPDPDAVPAVLVEHAAASLAANEVLFLDFHRHAENSPIHLSLLVPIFDPQDHRPLGVLVLRINPQVYLYHFIQQWPVPSQSAETLLVRREGETVLYLNELRFAQATALTQHFPLTAINLPAVKAVLGETGIVEGVDYRGRAVIADLRAVPGSPWFIVSKMDTAEVYAPLRQRLWQTILFFGALILMVGAGLMLIWRREQVSNYRAQIEAAEAVRASEEKFRLAFDTSPDAVTITRMSDGMFVSVNKGFEHITGYLQEELIGKTSAEINIWKDPADRRQVVEGLRARGEVRNYEAPFLTRDGEIHGLMSAVIIQLNGEPHILNITRDITERKRAEEELRESKALFETVVENIPLMIFLKEAEDLRFVLFNRAGEELLGYDRQALLGKNNLDLFPPEQAAHFMAKDREVLDGEAGMLDIPEEPIQTAMKGQRRLHTRKVCIRGADGTTKYLLGISEDITERVQAEEALSASEEKHRALIEQSLDGIVISDEHGNVAVWNKSMESITGIQQRETIGRPLWEIQLRLIPDEQKTPELLGQLQNGLKNILESKMDWPGESREQEIIHVNGTHKVVRDSSFLTRVNNNVNFGTIIHDITERKQAEEELIATEKLAQELLAASSQSRQALLSMVEDQKQTEAALRQQNQILSALQNTALELASQLELKKLLENIVRRACALVGTSAGLLDLVDPATKQLMPQIGVGVLEISLHLPPVQPGEGLTGTIWQTGEILVVPDYDQWSGRLGKFSRGTLGSVIGVPLLSGADVLGVLVIGSAAGVAHHFDTDTVELLNQFARLATVAVQNARLFANLQTELTERARAEENLRNLEAFNRAIITHSPLGISVRSRTGDLLSFNAAWREIWAISKEEYQEMLEEKSNTLIFDEKDVILLPYQEQVRQVYEQGGNLTLPDLKTRYYRPGNAEWVSQYYYAIMDDQGQVDRVVTLTQDISARKQAEDVVQKRNQMLLASHNIMLKIGTELHLPTLLDNILEQAQSLLDADRGGGIYLYESGGNVLRLVHGTGINQGRDDITIQVDEGAAGRVYQTSQPLIIDNYTDWEAHATILVADPPSTVMGVPLLLNDKAFGVLTLIANSQLRKFTDQDVQQAEMFATQAAIAIQNAQLYQQARQEITERVQAEEKIRQRAAELEMLYQSGLALNQLLSPQEIGGKIIELLEQKLDWHHTLIRTYNPQDETLELLALNQPDLKTEQERRAAEETYKKQVSRLDQGISGWVVQNSQIVRSGDVSHDPRYAKSYLGIHSGLYVPIKSDQRVIGVISIESEVPNAFDEADERLVATLANQAAIAFENARLYQTARQEIVERKRVEALLADERNQLAQRVEQRTADLNRVNSDLARALQAKDEFLASMSHELRTPLTGILGFSEVLQLKTYGDLSEKQHTAIKTIEESGRHLLDLINDILDLSKIEAGKLELQFDPCSLADICQASLHLIKGMAQHKHQHVHYTPPAGPIIVRADARRLKQLLVNLLSNAVKFTPEKGELGLEIQANESERNLKLIVWDKGIGIKPEDLQKLFKPFSQIDSSLTREFSGTGLGLSMVQRLTELHNGGIEVESNPGEGSRFTVILPWSPQDTTPIPYTPPLDTGRLVMPLPHSKSPLVMFADDNKMVLGMVADFLETKRYRVIKVRSGTELLERAAEFHPDIMLVDIQMPGMDGMETIRRIRSHADPLVAAAPVIAVTALAMPGDRETCLRAGANDYMSKPVRLKALAAAIQKLLEDKQ